MNKRLAATATLVTMAAAVAGLFAGPSNSASGGCPTSTLPPGARICEVSLTATGPSPSTVRMPAFWNLVFRNTDSLTHTIAFANGRCSLTVTPGEQEAGLPWVHCKNDTFTRYVGSYAYKVDGKFPGSVETTPLRRVVTLTASTHTIPGGARLTLHGQVLRRDQGSPLLITPPVPVVVLARHNSKQPFEPIATVRARFQGDVTNAAHYHASYGWKLNVQPDVTTTYIAKVTSQRLCSRPASQCAHPQGQVWSNPKSRTFTVRIRQ